MRRLTAGILAHVDAGKTTCIESMLYTAGIIRKAGRVDHRDTVLDYDEQERDHGITIYAKEAHFMWENTDVFVIDTPGHVDFSAEMERSLQVLDLAVMLINGQDGVQPHTETIWNCLQHNHIPCIVFINKMDISYHTEEELMNDLSGLCSDKCISWFAPDRDEQLAVINEELLSDYTETGRINDESVIDAFYRQEVVPVVFGSALKMRNVDKLMDLIAYFSRDIVYPEDFGARVYKISEDEHGTRLTHVKITGGKLTARQKINDEEKVDQIRLYNGTSYEMLNEAEAGMVVSLKGLSTFETGMGLGFEEDRSETLLQAYMDYELVLPSGANVLVLNDTLKELAAEDPQLEINIDEHTKKVQIRIMGRMQMEVLQKRIADRSGITVGFTTGRILYQETIREPVEGAGHFEPLRHYAEVHVRLEPLPRGSGLKVSSECSSDMLSTSWQKSILAALSRKNHKGVLTGSSLTDVEIILTAGKGSIKHTTGGDFRQASLRAVRQALMKADNILLEPYYSFTLDIPVSALSHALFDLEQRNASVEVNDTGTDRILIKGEGPVRTLINYQDELISYTGGTGRFSCMLKGYQETSAQEEIVSSSGYDPEMDMYNSADSVFCAHGTSYTVHWKDADEQMDIQLKEDAPLSSYSTNVRYHVSDADLGYILDMTSGKNRNPEKLKASEREKKAEAEKEKKYIKTERKLPLLMIVDGYNMIYSWDSLKQLAYEDLSSARDMLVRYLYNYQAYLDYEIIVVFDAYKVQDNSGSVTKKGGVTVVYTKTQETADAWMEKSSYDLRGKYQVTYATSDALIQNAVFSQGALRMSAKELENRLLLAHVILQR